MRTKKTTIKSIKPEKNILIKKSGDMFDIFINTNKDLDYFGIRSEHYELEDKELSKIIKTKSSIKLDKKDIDKIISKIREVLINEHTDEDSSHAAD